MENPWKSLREKAGKTQLQIAIETGYVPSAVSAWENGGGNPHLKNAAVVAKAYGVTERRIIDIIVAQKQAAGAA